MPIINVTPGSVTFAEAGGVNQPQPIVTPNTANVSDSSYTFILHNQSVCSMNVNVAAGAGVGASTPFFLGDDDAPNSKTLVAQSIKLGVIPINAAQATSLTIIGNDTGATTSITVTNNVTLNSLMGL